MPKSRQLLVRTALVTGSTIATLIGAQTLALTDQHKPAASLQQPISVQVGSTSAQVSAVNSQSSVNVQQPVSASIVDTSVKAAAQPVVISHVAPTIIVLSGDNQGSANSDLVARAAGVPSVPQVNQINPTPVPPTPQPTETPVILPTTRINLAVQPYYSQPSPIVIQQYPVFQSSSSR